MAVLGLVAVCMYATSVAHATDGGIEHVLPALTIEAAGPLTALDRGLIETPEAHGPISLIQYNIPAYVAVGDTEVVWLLTYSDGRKEVYRQAITVQDTVPPVFSTVVPAEITKKSTGKARVHFEMPEARDAVDIDVDVSSSHRPGAKFPVGNTTVTFTATDDSGNTSVVNMTVSVVDPRIKNLQIDATHDTISVSWDPYPGDPVYRLVITEIGTENKYTAKIIMTSHVISNVSSGTEYTVTVGVRGEKDTVVKKTITTLDPPPP